MSTSSPRAQLYGGTVDLLQDTFADWGIEVTFVDQDDPDAWRAAVRRETRALFAESITNPIAQVLDVRTVAEIAHAAGVPLVIDNTVATPYLQRAKDFGADIVVHSATKFLGGHGTSLGGVIVDLGTFDFTRRSRSAGRSSPRPYRRVPGGSLVDRFGATGSPYIALVKTKYVHDLGPSLSAFNAFQLLQGLETLDLRIARHSATALEAAPLPRAASRRRPRAPPGPRVQPVARRCSDLPAAGRGIRVLVRPALHAATPTPTSRAWRRSSGGSRSCAWSPTSATRAAWSRTRPR